MIQGLQSCNLIWDNEYIQCVFSVHTRDAKLVNFVLAIVFSIVLMRFIKDSWCTNKFERVTNVSNLLTNGIT